MTLRPCYIEYIDDNSIKYLNKYQINFIVDGKAILYIKNSQEWVHQYIPHSFTFEDIITRKYYLVKNHKSSVIEISSLPSKVPTIHQLYDSDSSEDENFKWNLVSEGNIQSKINNGYINTSDKILKFCLPPDPTKKDIIAASGHWMIELNNGQKVSLSPSQIRYPVYNWKKLGKDNKWIGVGVSTDGNTIVSTAKNDYIYISRNGGITWMKKGNPFSWSTIAISGNGNTIISAVKNGYIYISHDFGDNWKEVTISGDWISVASSINGTVLIAAARNDFIYISKDSGNTWLSGSSGKRNWSSLCCSNDGSKILSAVNGGNLFVSIDYGETWAVKMSYHNFKWTSVSSSFEGTNLVACCSPGNIYLSTDSGYSWTSQYIDSVNNWKYVYMAQDSSQIIGISETGIIYIYSGKEQKWILQNKIKKISWTGAAYSTYKKKFYLSPSSGTLIMSKDDIIIDHNFQILYGTTLQLIYVKDGIFMPIYFNGQIE